MQIEFRLSNGVHNGGQNAWRTITLCITDNVRTLEGGHFGRENEKTPTVIGVFSAVGSDLTRPHRCGLCVASDVTGRVGAQSPVHHGALPMKRRPAKTPSWTLWDSSGRSGGVAAAERTVGDRLRATAVSAGVRERAVATVEPELAPLRFVERGADPRPKVKGLSRAAELRRSDSLRHGGSIRERTERRAEAVCRA